MKKSRKKMKSAYHINAKFLAEENHRHHSEPKFPSIEYKCIISKSSRRTSLRLEKQENHVCNSNKFYTIRTF